MRAIFVTFIALLLAASVAILGCGSAGEGAAPGASAEGAGSEASAEPDEPAIAQQFCPVMGGPVDKVNYVDHNGRRVYFCCAGCETVFLQDPEKYLKVLDEQLGQAG